MTCRNGYAVLAILCGALLLVCSQTGIAASEAPEQPMQQVQPMVQGLVVNPAPTTTVADTPRGADAPAAPAAPIAEPLGRKEYAPDLQGPPDLQGQQGRSGSRTGHTETASVPQPSEFSWGGYFRAIGMMFLLLGVLWVGVWWMRRSGRFPRIPRVGALPRDALFLEGQLSLGPRKGLMVVRFLNKRVLLGVSDQHITLLSETELDHESSFAEYMDDLRNTPPVEPVTTVMPGTPPSDSTHVR